MGRTRGPQGFTLMENDHGRKGGACSGGLAGARKCFSKIQTRALSAEVGETQNGAGAKGQMPGERMGRRGQGRQSRMGECGGKRVLP